MNKNIVNITKIAAILILLLSSNLIFGQQVSKKSEYSKLLVGTWKLDNMEFKDSNIPEEYLDLLMKKYEEIKDSIVFVFNEDKTYFSKGIGASKTGVWQVAEDGKYVIVTIDGKSEGEKTRILKITNNELIMAPMQEHSTNSKFTLYRYE